MATEITETSFDWGNFSSNLLKAGVDAYTAKQMSKATSEQDQWINGGATPPNPAYTDSVYEAPEGNNNTLLIVGGVALLAVVGLVLVLK